MYEGQRSESILIGNYEISEEDYFKVISNKTSIFFSMACELGTIIAGASEHYRKSLVSYGYNLGIAYQMMDDLKSVIFLKMEKEDKSYQTDFERRLVTLPIIVAYKLSNKEEKEIIKNFYNGKIFNKDSVIEIISCDMVIAEVKKKIACYVLKAKEELRDIKESKYKIALQEYCEHFLKETE
ncbi:polyprenyl synthetase [Kineothrix alysoides]|uniref:Polyprenyl synthetase n=1 Tax=Kineothrix alysoides TaxID=1469948 RepID=A0A4R1QUJ2_9FIRM|nr:polyprenyl synthetase family protein [Kineothrix alysoides]TCL57639.1 polyprenyl synthetase [Kineothrix alysoides]